MTTHPTPPLPDAIDAWVAAGVQHAVLLRALPVVRHDLAGPLSVMRMGATVLKRKLAQGDLQPAQAAERVEQLESHLADLGEHVRRLRHWDRNGAERLPVRATVTEALALAQPLLAVRGALLTPLPEDGWPEAPATYHPLLYVLLASLYHLAERPNVAPGPITLTLAGDALQLHIGGALPSDLPPMDVAAPPTPPIDAAALHALARHWALPLDVTADRVRIGLPRG